MLKKLLINTSTDLPEKKDMTVPMKHNHIYEMLRYTEEIEILPQNAL